MGFVLVFHHGKVLYFLSIYFFLLDVDSNLKNLWSGKCSINVQHFEWRRTTSSSCNVATRCYLNCNKGTSCRVSAKITSPRWRRPNSLLECIFFNVVILRRSPPLHGLLLIVWNVSIWNWSKTNAVLYKIMKLQKISSLSDLFSELVWNQSPSSLPQPSTSLLFVPCVCIAAIVMETCQHSFHTPPLSSLHCV